MSPGLGVRGRPPNEGIRLRLHFWEGIFPAQNEFRWSPTRGQGEIQISLFAFGANCYLQVHPLLPIGPSKGAPLPSVPFRPIGGRDEPDGRGLRSSWCLFGASASKSGGHGRLKLVSGTRRNFRLIPSQLRDQYQEQGREDAQLAALLLGSSSQLSLPTRLGCSSAARDQQQSIEQLEKQNINFNLQDN